MPPANRDNLRRYARHLATRPSFPFRAAYVAGTGPFDRSEHPVTVRGLLGPDSCDEEDGVRCVVEQHGEPFEVPLADLSVRNRPQRQLVEDYTYWFGGWFPEEAGAEARAPWMPFDADAGRPDAAARLKALAACGLAG